MAPGWIRTFLRKLKMGSSTRPDRIRQGTIDRGGAMDLVAASQEPGPVGFELDTSDRLAGQGQDMTGPDPFFFGRTGPAGGEQGVVAGDRFGLHEEVGERRVGGVGPGRCQDQFGSRT